MISSNISGSNGRPVWLMANGRLVRLADRRGEIHLMPGPERRADYRCVDPK